MTKMGLHEEAQELSNKWNITLHIVVSPGKFKSFEPNGELQHEKAKPDYIDPDSKVWVRDTIFGERYCVTWKAYESDKENLRLMPAPQEKELTKEEEEKSKCGEVYDGE